MPTHHRLVLRKKEGPTNIVGIDVLGSRNLNCFSIVDEETIIDQIPDDVAIKEHHLDSMAFPELTSANPKCSDTFGHRTGHTPIARVRATILRPRHLRHGRERLLRYESSYNSFWRGSPLHFADAQKRIPRISLPPRRSTSQVPASFGGSVC